MEIEFYKYQGTGNDFIIIDNRNGQLSLSELEVARWCDRRFGIGADGLMLLESEPGFDFRMVYYNSDGRLSSMCGNGGRCITAFASLKGLVSNKSRFVAVDGPHEALIDGDDVSLKMRDVKVVEVEVDGYYLNTGSPHFVKFVHGLDSMDVHTEGAAIRYSDRFKAEGTNVNFVEKVDQEFFVRTYERGVEGETLSCGTGVTAVALVAAKAGMLDKNTCYIRTRGGNLEVSFERVLDHHFYNIWLKGPAKLVYQGTITPEVQNVSAG